MQIRRNEYLRQLIESRGNGLIKVVTGLRRSGKSYLLGELFYAWLIMNGMEASHIIKIDLEDIDEEELLNPIEIKKRIKEKIVDDEPYVVMIDEVQRIHRILHPMYTEGKIVRAKEGEEGTVWFQDVLLGLYRIPNVDVYVTGSNSKFLSTDIMTEMRGRGLDIHIQPLSFTELQNHFVDLSYEQILDEYLRYGGLPFIYQSKDSAVKESYLLNQLRITYTADIVERYKIRNPKGLETLIKVLADSGGSYVNVRKIADTFQSAHMKSMDEETIKKYLGYLEDSFLIKKVSRYDVRGRKEVGALAKYYFADTGLQRAATEFSLADTGHLFESLVFNELIHAGYRVRIGNINYFDKDENGKSVRKSAEIDFMAQKLGATLYVQAALHVDDPEVLEREKAPLLKVKDSYPKYIVTKSRPINRQDRDGIQYVSLEELIKVL